MDDNLDKVSIRFKPGAYGAYRNMNNKIWYALAEYVDNALQSYLDNREQLMTLEGKNYQLEIQVNIEPHVKIEIIDNAGGINKMNFIRAFEPANIPVDNTGLSEFGMGMKIASVWLGDNYTVRSSSLNEPVARHVSFDLKKVVAEEKEDLNVENIPTNSLEHYSAITITNLSRNAPTGNGRQMVKIKNHLTSIYRKFINNGELKLVFNGEQMSYEEPVVLNAPYYDNLKGEKILWKKDVCFDVGKYKVSGFIGLLKEMSGIHSGISLFRRGRIITGSHDEKYHPKILCGSPGSPRDKRLFGDLELEGFDVSYEKGSFLQSEEFDIFLKAFKHDLSQPEFNLLKQGDKYRKGSSPEQKKRTAKKIIEKLDKDSTLEGHTFTKEDLNPTPPTESTVTGTHSTTQPTPTLQELSNEQTSVEIEFENVKYELKLDIINDSADQDLYRIFKVEKTDGRHIIMARLNLDHTFFEKYNMNFKKHTDYFPLIDIIKSLILSEIFARRQGTIDGGNIRTNLNRIIQKIT